MAIGTWSPTLDKGVGYVRFGRPLPGDDWCGKTVYLHDRDGTAHEATADTLPFVDKEKQLPRAIWTRTRPGNWQVVGSAAGTCAD